LTPRRIRRYQWGGAIPPRFFLETDTVQKEYDAATVAAAKQAVNTLWGFRYDMADTGTLELFWSEARYIRSEAKAAGRKIADADWIYLAGLADNVCDDDGLPRLFDVEGAAE
jgi:hypothetical protein